MQGSIIRGPGPGAIEAGGASAQGSLPGQTLFMIIWSTRMKDLKAFDCRGQGSPGGRLTSFKPRRGGRPSRPKRDHPHRYSNIGSFGGLSTGFP